MGERGTPVDWWIILKAPKISSGATPAITGGWAYFYIDSTTKELKLSPFNLQEYDRGAIPYTMEDVYDKEDPYQGRLFWNDQPPGNDTASSAYGHTKGMMTFDADGGFLITHSVPRTFNHFNRGYFFRSDETIYGQSAMCLSLTRKGIDDIGLHYQYQRPYIYDPKMPIVYKNTYPNVDALINGQAFLRTPATQVLDIVTKGGARFTGFSKNAPWDKDLDTDLIAPTLKVGMYWETWMRPLFPSACPPQVPYPSINVLNIAAGGLTWKETNDHSKWGISMDPAKPWVCIGTINRMESQRKRGGGAICMSNSVVYKLFSGIIANKESC